MVSASRVEGGTVISARVRKTIQSIREIVKGYSEVDIYTTLQETNMDPNETAQKLLNQEPFHEVRRRRDKKETMGYKDFIEPRKHVERVDHVMKFQTYSNHNISIEPRKYARHAVQGINTELYSDRNVQGGGYTRNTRGINQEFRVVRDNRINHNTNREPKFDSHQITAPSSLKLVSNVNKKGNQRSSSGRNLSQRSNGSIDSKARHLRDVNLIGTDKKEISGRRGGVPNTLKSSIDSKQHSNNSVLGVYSSSSDPVHVPSSDSRSLAAVKREVGVVGNRRQSSDNSVNKVGVVENRRQSSDNSAKILSKPRDSVSNPVLVQDISSSVEPYQSVNTVSKSEQHEKITVPDSLIHTVSVGRPASSSQSNSRQQQKASQPSKEWKPKSGKKSGSGSPGVIVVDAKLPSDRSKDVKSDTSHLHEIVLQVNVTKNENVLIPQHIQVSETDCSQLTFGSFGVEPDFANNIASEVQNVNGSKESLGHSESLLVSAPKFSSDESSEGKSLDKLVDHVRHSGSKSAVPGVAHVPQMADNRDSLGSHSLENYSDIGMVGDNRPPYIPLESHQRHNLSEFQSFSAYDPQTGYDIPYFRATMNEPIRRNDIPSPQESSSSHMANNIPASTISLVQAPQAVAQMYPQVHMSHFPIRQFMPPLYVPSLAMSGYSNNPSAAPYPTHPSNASSYLLLPGGGNSHLTAATALKYGIHQFKPLPSASPTGFGSFTNPSAYAINAPPAVVGNAPALEDSSRLKYKDGNLYHHNLQGESSEIWVQNTRDVPSAAAAYYNLSGQSGHSGGAYMANHSSHGSYNAAAAAVAQSSHMQFPTSLYHAPMVGAHHLAPANVGAAAAAPASQLTHLNWPTNF